MFDNSIERAVDWLISNSEGLPAVAERTQSLPEISNSGGSMEGESPHPATHSQSQPLLSAQPDPFLALSVAAEVVGTLPPTPMRVREPKTVITTATALEQLPLPVSPDPLQRDLTARAMAELKDISSFAPRLGGALERQSATFRAESGPASALRVSDSHSVSQNHSGPAESSPASAVQVSDGERGPAESGPTSALKVSESGPALAPATAVYGAASARLSRSARPPESATVLRDVRSDTDLPARPWPVPPHRDGGEPQNGSGDGHEDNKAAAVAAEGERERETRTQLVAAAAGVAEKVGMREFEKSRGKEWQLQGRSSGYEWRYWHHNHWWQYDEMRSAVLENALRAGEGSVEIVLDTDSICGSANGCRYHVSLTRGEFAQTNVVTGFVRPVKRGKGADFALPPWNHQLAVGKELEESVNLDVAMPTAQLDVEYFLRKKVEVENDEKDSLRRQLDSLSVTSVSANSSMTIENVGNVVDFDSSRPPSRDGGSGGGGVGGGMTSSLQRVIARKAGKWVNFHSRSATASRLVGGDKNLLPVELADSENTDASDPFESAPPTPPLSGDNFFSIPPFVPPPISDRIPSPGLTKEDAQVEVAHIGAEESGGCGGKNAGNVCVEMTQAEKDARAWRSAAMGWSASVNKYPPHTTHIPPTHTAPHRKHPRSHPHTHTPLGSPKKISAPVDIIGDARVKDMRGHKIGGGGGGGGGG